MKTILSILLIGLTMQPVMAKDSVNHSGQASKHSTLAALESMQTSVTVASAVASTPVLLSVAAGVVVAGAADASHRKIEAHQRRPLTVTSIVITADPAPNIAVAAQGDVREVR